MIGRNFNNKNELIVYMSSRAAAKDTKDGIAQLEEFIQVVERDESFRHNLLTRENYISTLKAALEDEKLALIMFKGEK